MKGMCSMKSEDYIVKTRKDGSCITVKDIQKSLLEMMVDIDQLCRKNKISYVLTGGSALGAVRHQGFIPWDDDLDIAIQRKDFKRFIKVLEEQLPEQYTFHCYEKNKKYNVTIPPMKIRKKNTYIKEVNTLLANKCSDCDGIFVDVMVLDNVSKYKILDVPFRIVNGLLMLIINGFENLRINPIPLKSLFIGIAKFYGKINRKSGWIGFDLTWTYINPFKGHIFKYEDVFPAIDIKFENTKFMIANNYDSFLRMDIGEDYMTLPPENKRIAKHTVDINLHGSGPEDE